MLLPCPYCSKSATKLSESRSVVRHGHFYRKSDSKSVQRFRCLCCKKCFSFASLHPCFRQNKRHKNEKLRRLLSSGVSQRRSARLLKIHRTTVARKLIFLGQQARLKLEKVQQELPLVTEMQFDDLETFEHTKCKPLSVTLAVEKGTRRILGFEVSRMPAKGLLAKISLKKYGPRIDERAAKRKILFARISHLIAERAVIQSDSNPHYPPDVKVFFPGCLHQFFIGKRGAVTGQGELKKTRFDPLFSLNHTCAKLRADVCRLIRRTWCTTKRPDRLADHLSLYVLYHNQHL